MNIGPHDSPLSIQDVRTATTEYLRDYIASKKALASSVSPHYGALWSAIETLAITGGKRFRPYMVSLGYGAFAPQTSTAAWLPAAAATELLHIALLVHDDIIDRDTIRYGIRNISGQQDDAYKPYVTDDTERRHFADSAAMLAGDLLIAGAYELLYKTPAQPEVLAKAAAHLHEAIFRVGGGELLDTESAFRHDTPLDPLLVAREKTSYYSFCAPLCIGGELGGADARAIETLHSFGLTLGEAFQLQDDLLGMFGDADTSGKSTDGDLREGKYTYLVQQFYALANAQQQAAFAAAFGKANAPVASQAIAKAALVESGAQQAVQTKIAELETTASALLDNLALQPAYHQAFVELIYTCTRRNA